MKKRLRRLSTAGQAGAVIWLTGLSGAGKTTLAQGLAARLHERGYTCQVIDGDDLRRGLNADLGFSPKDRSENVRRIGVAAADQAKDGLVCITACISPYRADRQRARQAAHPAGFHEVHLNATLAQCEARDPKGLYRKARAGMLPDFTGVDAPYEAPLTPELVLNTGQDTIEASLERLLDYVCRQLPA